MSVEYGQFDPGSRRWCQQTEVIMNFLSRGIDEQEPYYPFPSETAPLLYGAIEDGKMIAAASVVEDTSRDNQLSLSLMAVEEGRRGEGIGSALLETVEQSARRLGAHTLTVLALGSVREFYYDRGYVDHPDTDSELVVKYLGHASASE